MSCDLEQVLSAVWNMRMLAAEEALCLLESRP